MERKLILASKSPRRSELLSSVGADFTIMTRHTDESYEGNPHPSNLVCELSKRKLLAVLENVSENDIVISADTIVYCSGEIFGKPKDDEEAFSMLKKMSGKAHEVYTGISVGNKEKIITEYECTKVYFRNITDKEIRNYIQTCEVRDKAGAYAIHEKAALFVEKIDGDYFNIVGLPLCHLGNILRNEFDYIL